MASLKEGRRKRKKKTCPEEALEEAIFECEALVPPPPPPFFPEILYLPMSVSSFSWTVYCMNKTGKGEHLKAINWPHLNKLQQYHLPKIK